MNKQLLSLLLLMVVATMPVAAYDFTVDGLYYNQLSDSTVEVVNRSNYFTSYLSGHLVIPDKVTYEGVDYTVTRIGWYAFYRCNITSVEIPNTVTSIETSSFYECRYLTSIEFPSSITRICSAFNDCVSLTSIHIPASVVYLEQNSFSMCPGLTSITVDEDNPVYDSRENCNAIIETATNMLISGCQNTVIPSSVTSLGMWAFGGCTGLTSIDLPPALRKIPNYAFYQCTGLTSIDIPETVTEIGYDAFRGCTGLTTIDLPASLGIIEHGAFSENPNLISLEIPSNVYYIYTGVLLMSGASLTSLKVASDNQYYDSREDCNAIIRTSTNELIAGCQNTVLPTTVTSIAESAFSGCVGLTSFEIPGTITNIGGGAFLRCTNLERVTIPNTITTIPRLAFAHCEKLKCVTIPESVVSFGSEPFAYCYALSRVISKPLVPPTNETQHAFYSSNANAVLFVPNESLDAYRADNVWGKFVHIVPFIGAGPGDVNGDGNVSIGDVTNLIDMLINGDAPAYYDVNGDGQVSIADITALIDQLLGAN
jgi:hypothetical protein